MYGATGRVARGPRGHASTVDLTLPDVAFLVVGLAALLAGVLPRLVAGRPVSLPIVFLLLGIGLGLVPGMSYSVDPTTTRRSPSTSPR